MQHALFPPTLRGRTLVTWLNWDFAHSQRRIDVLNVAAEFYYVLDNAKAKIYVHKKRNLCVKNLILELKKHVLAFSC